MEGRCAEERVCLRFNPRCVGCPSPLATTLGNLPALGVGAPQRSVHGAARGRLATRMVCAMGVCAKTASRTRYTAGMPGESLLCRTLPGTTPLCPTPTVSLPTVSPSFTGQGGSGEVWADRLFLRTLLTPTRGGGRAQTPSAAAPEPIAHAVGRCRSNPPPLPAPCPLLPCRVSCVLFLFLLL